ncbi:MAG: NADH-quinone oxidoreductase subunit NuoG [candidate division Zixibacteria bacterium]|nr:NADH-quinone oxidoreductase subunit NuoG [candidate division Zixibacteria bacterium]
MAENGGNTVTLTIDGRQVTVPKGTTVLEAAQSIGIDIPTFCWHPKLDSIGACRMCLVDIEKMPKPAVSCATEVAQGMVVSTTSDRIVAARKGVLEFLLLNHPLDCPTCDKGGECDLQDITFKYGTDKSRFAFPKLRIIDEHTKTTFDDKRIGPEIIRNMNRCVTCFKCVRFNKEIAGEYDLGAYQRANHTVIDAAPGEQVDNIYSGNVVEICPVGALTNTDWRYKVRVWLTKQADSISPHDADGQNIKLWYDHRRIFRATSRRNDAVDEGWICDLARYGYQFIDSPDRLMSPLIKRQGRQVAATWAEALELVARRFRDIRDKKGSVCIAGLSGGNQSAETMALFNRFFRTVLRSNSVDYRLDYIDLKDGEITEAYNCLYTAPFQIAELEQADAALVFASNFIKEHPIVNLRLRKAVRKSKARLFTANPVETKSADISVDELIYRPDTETAFVVALLHALIDQRLYKNCPDGRAMELQSRLSPSSLTEAAGICGIEVERISSLARQLASAQNPFILAGDYLTASTQRYQIGNALYNLANLLGVPDGKAIILASHADSIGAERVGLRPALSADLAGRLAEAWKEPIPDSTGLNTSQIFRAILDEEIDAVMILGANPAMRYPDGPFVNAALDKLDFLVVADLFETATTAKADVVFPLAGWAEQDGSFVNLEGRQQRFQRALPPKAEIKTGLEIIREIAETMGEPLAGDDAALRNETERLVSSWVRRPRVMDKFYDVKPAPPVGHEGYPYRLLVGNDLHHVGYLTEHCPSLIRFTREPYVELSPSLAARLGVDEAALVRVESTTGRLVLPVRISEQFDGDVVFIPNNFAAVEVNTLVSRDGGGWVKIERLDE